MALSASLCTSAQHDLDFFIGTWDFSIWGNEQMDRDPDLQGTWVLARGLDSAVALTGAVRLNDGPGVQGGDFTRELIAYDAWTKRYTRTIATNTGATYLLATEGWSNDTLVWIGEQHTANGVVALRERIVRTGPASFQAVFHRQENGNWILQSMERLVRY